MSDVAHSSDMTGRGAVVVIPARFNSSRLPGKPLADIHGRPMIEHVWRNACASQASRVVIATDDERIRTVCEGFGAEVVMTRADHPEWHRSSRGSGRAAGTGSRDAGRQRAGR